MKTGRPMSAFSDRIEHTDTQAHLTQLWRRRLDTLIAGVANGDPYYQQIANAAEHISAEQQGRFLIELLQNANDQAVRAGLTDSLVTITRTDRIIAFGNNGQPFDADKVDRITSIFMSDKTADECIGNKGIGFKAVYQVSDSAEVFSSALGDTLAEGAKISFRMVRRPFDDEAFMTIAKVIVSDLLDNQTARREQIQTRFAGDDAVDVVLREAARAAWFSFPIPATKDLFESRLAELQLSETILRETQTLIVLPLEGDTELAGRVSRAIDEIQGTDQHLTDDPPAASLLFLPGIGRIDVVDRTRAIRSELRKKVFDTEKLSDGIMLHRKRTTRTDHYRSISETDPMVSSQDWWVVERMIGGGDHRDESCLEAERQSIRDSIQSLRLPEENWKGVEEVGHPMAGS